MFEARQVADGANLQFITNATLGSFAVQIAEIAVRQLPGNHASQTVSARRPTYQTGGGQHWLLFDGVDDELVTPAIAAGTDKAQVFAAVRKLSDAAGGIVAEFGAGGVGSVTGSFTLSAPNHTEPGANYRVDLRGDGAAGGTGWSVSSYAAPTTNVVAGLLDIAGAARADEVAARVDGLAGTQTAAGSGTAGGGGFGTHALHIGRRSSGALPFNGRLYGLVVRFGPNLTENQITATEAWMRGRAGL